MIKAPPRIAEAARKRVAERMKEIRHSLTAINEGRPGDAEPEMVRREQVYQARTGRPAEEARRVAMEAGKERIFGRTVDFVDVAFFERGRRAARAVARIITKDGVGFGTGFLISPRLLMTNNHVIADAAACNGLLAEFDYERDIHGRPLRVTRFALAPQACFLTNDENNLDYTVVALGPRVFGEKKLSDFGYLPISNARDKHQLGDYVSIIQHPDGRPKEAVLRENQLVARAGTALHYVADTEPGASGSPVFNVQFSVVALHHWGTPHRELVDEHGKEIPKTVNEGIRASSIFGDLTTLRSGLKPDARALIDEALRLGLQSPAPAPVGSDPERNDGGSSGRTESADAAAVQIDDDGTATWKIPLTVSVRLGGLPAGSAATAAAGEQPAVVSAAATGGEAKVEIDPDYPRRPGYVEDFLDGFTIPLPTLSAAQRAIAARNKRARPGDNPFELKYHHYSVIMNGARRLAFVSAVNVNGALAKDFDRQKGIITDPFADEGGEEASELWFTDPRISEDQQTPRDFYQKQKTFDAQGVLITDKKTGGHHVNRMFQQGHLTRRQDPVWGDDPKLIAFANADTFHVTNCAPQVGFFNMGMFKSEAVDAGASEAAKKKKKGHPGGNLHWRALEEYVQTNARADREKLTVFTGPIFDDKNDFEWDRDRLEGFKAPREFWKLILRVEDGALQATALVADQTPLIDYLPEMLDRGESIQRLPYEKIRRYHVSVAELESRTGLKFGDDVRGADTFVRRGTGTGRRFRRVETIEDISLVRPQPRRKSSRRKSVRAKKKKGVKK